MLIPKGATSQSINVRIVDSTNGTPETGVLFSTSGLDLWYRREGALSVDITEVDLATPLLTDAYLAGGFLHINDGWYRVDVPDAAFASGVNGVQIGGTVTGMVVHAPYVQLTDLDLFDSGFATLAADIAAILIDTSTTLETHLTELKGAGFVAATHSNEAIRVRGDSAWTGGLTTSDSGTAQAGSATTITLRVGAPAGDNVLEGHLIFISAGTGVGQSKAIAENGYDGGTKVATIIGTWEVTPDGTSVYDVFPDAITEVDPPTAAVIADAVWDENTTGHQQANTFGEQCKNDIDAILADTGELQVDWVEGGRLDLLVDLILADTGELQTDDVPTLIAALNNVSAAQVQTQVDASMVTHGLDHLFLAAVIGADVTDNSLVAKLLSSAATADFDTFDHTTDSLQAIRDKQTDIEADTQNLQSRLPDALVGGFMKADTKAINGAVVIGDGDATPWDGI